MKTAILARTLLASALTLWAGSALGQSTYTFRQGVDDYFGASSTFTEYQPPEAQIYNYGGDNKMLIYSPLGEGAPKKVGFMRFDLSEIPAPVSVTEVLLTLCVAGHPQRTEPGYAQTLHIYPILRNELNFGQSNGMVEIGTVTFLAAAYDEMNPVGWGSNNMGDYGPVAGEDYDLTSIGSYTLTEENATESFITLSLNPSVVQQWINNPSSNLGFVIVFEQSVWDQAVIYTGNEPGAIYRPLLTVTVTPIPEPNVAMLLGLGFLVWSLHRKLPRSL